MTPVKPYRLPKAAPDCKIQFVNDIKVDGKVYTDAIVELREKSQAPLNFNSQVPYNGVDLSKYKFRSGKGDMLLFVGRLGDFKSPKHAISADRKAGFSFDLVVSLDIDLLHAPLIFEKSFLVWMS